MSNDLVLGRKRNFDLQGESPRFRDRFSIFRHALKVKFDCLSNVVSNFLDGPSRRYTTRQIRDVGGQIVRSALDNHSVFLHGLVRSPACARTLFMVPI